MFYALAAILSVVAIIVAIQANERAGRLAWRVQKLEEELQKQRQGAAPSAPPPQPATASTEAQTAPPAAPRYVPPEPEPIPADKAPKRPRGQGVESFLGALVAGFVGTAAITLGIAFFVGYPVKDGSVGPTVRVLAGLIAGVLEIILGQVIERRGRGLHVLARTLTGGGAALLFFSVFAAHSFYELISPLLATIGLAFTTLIVMGLSLRYQSRAVALLGVVGAFLTPVAIGGDINEGAFALGYIAAINATVLLLGWRKNWQSLYNTSFVFTFFYVCFWFFREVFQHGEHVWGVALTFTLIFYAQYAGLALVKLTRGRSELDARMDVSRLLSATLLLLVAVREIFDEAQLDSWVAAVFLILSAAHFVLVRIAWNWLRAYRSEVLVLLAGGVTFGTLAFPLHFDGAWVSLGWAIEGCLLSLLALRFGITPFATAGPLIGAVGLAKSLVFDDVAEHGDDRLFLNARFLIDALSAALLALQAWLLRRLPARSRAAQSRNSLLWLAATAGVVIAVLFDGLRIFGSESSWAWMPAILMLPLSAGCLLLLGEREQGSALSIFGNLALCAVPLMLSFCVFLLAFEDYDARSSYFFNASLLLAFACLGATVWASSQLPGERIEYFPRRIILHVLSVLAFVYIVSREVDRTETAWGDTAITLWWGVSALGLLVLGLWRRLAYLRRTALFLFGITIAKTFLFDLADLSGLVRAAVFCGVGVLLLLSSWIYQRSVAHLEEHEAPRPD